MIDVKERDEEETFAIIIRSAKIEGVCWWKK